MRIRESMIQASLYIGVFFITYCGYGLQFGFEIKSTPIEENRTMFFGLSIFIRIFLPLQG